MMNLGYYGLKFVLGGIGTKLYTRVPLTAKAVILGLYVKNRQVPLFFTGGSFYIKLRLFHLNSFPTPRSE